MRVNIVGSRFGRGTGRGIGTTKLLSDWRSLRRDGIMVQRRDVGTSVEKTYVWKLLKLLPTG